MLIDTHCHLNDEQFHDDIDEVIGRARDAGVRYMVVPGVDVAGSKAAVALAERYENVYAAVGVHPESLEKWDEQDLSVIEELAAHEKVVAIGEIGLDYYWDVAPHDIQKFALSRQIDMARRLQLPVIIHNRDSTGDMVELLERECRGDVVGVMHCFTGSVETAKRCMALGFFISFGGPVTFKNASNVRETAKQIPDSSLLIETDSPYLAPHPFRGKRNEPSRVRVVAETLAEVREVPIANIEDVTLENAFRLFTKMSR